MRWLRRASLQRALIGVVQEAAGEAARYKQLIDSPLARPGDLVEELRQTATPPPDWTILPRPAL